jgi:putative PIN family toxin of toxin-antitoxin system
MESGTGGAPHLIVFDASTVVGAALGPQGTPRQAIRLARRHARIALSEAVFAEIADVLARPKFSTVLTAARREEVLELLTAGSLWFDPQVRVAVCRDPNDDKYLELALEAKAGAIISSDLDLLALDGWHGLRVLKPAGYLDWVRSA